jgi:hypothetical protein
VHGDLDGSRAFHGDGGELEVADVECPAPAADGGLCGEEPVGPVPEGLGGVGRRGAVGRRRDQGDVPGNGSVVQRGQGLAGVPEQHIQVPAAAWGRARQERGRDVQRRSLGVGDRPLEQSGAAVHGRGSAVPAAPGSTNGRPKAGTARPAGT